MALRPASPVQLVTRALRSIPPAYQTSVWHAGSFHYTVATFGTHRAAAFTTGTEYARSSGTGVSYLRARRKHGHAVGDSRDGTTFGEPRSSARPFLRRWPPVIQTRSMEPCDIVGDTAACPTQQPIQINDY